MKFTQNVDQIKIGILFFIFLHILSSNLVKIYRQRPIYNLSINMAFLLYGQYCESLDVEV